MIYTEKKLCLFVHFSEKNYIPHNVQVYVNELSHYFEEVLVVTNKRDIDHVANFNDNVRLRFEKNEGHDFGIFYRFACGQNFSKYSEIAIVNDTNIVLKELKDVFLNGRKRNADFWGLIDSNQKSWFSSHKDNYCIQNHFIVLNKAAIKLFSSFIDSFDAQSVFKENNKKAQQRLIIDRWKVGFSQFLLKNGLKPYAFIDGTSKNLAYSEALDIVNRDYPLLKKKVYYDADPKSRREWSYLIKDTLPKNWNSEWILEELEENRKQTQKSFLKRLIPF